VEHKLTGIIMGMCRSERKNVGEFNKKHERKGRGREFEKKRW
jgi:hypothetical protein